MPNTGLQIESERTSPISSSPSSFSRFYEHLFQHSHHGRPPNHYLQFLLQVKKKETVGRNIHKHKETRRSPRKRSADLEQTLLQQSPSERNPTGHSKVPVLLRNATPIPFKESNLSALYSFHSPKLDSSFPPASLHNMHNRHHTGFVSSSGGSDADHNTSSSSLSFPANKFPNPPPPIPSHSLDSQTRTTRTKSRGHRKHLQNPLTSSQSRSRTLPRPQHNNDNDHQCIYKLFSFHCASSSSSTVTNGGELHISHSKGAILSTSIRLNQLLFFYASPKLSGFCTTKNVWSISPTFTYTLSSPSRTCRESHRPAPHAIHP